MIVCQCGRGTRDLDPDGPVRMGRVPWTIAGGTTLFSAHMRKAALDRESRLRELEVDWKARPLVGVMNYSPCRPIASMPDREAKLVPYRAPLDRGDE
jgi:hypothetical protein